MSNSFATTAAAKPLPKPKPKLHSPGPHRILYVEDDLNTLTSTYELLTLLGHSVTPAASAEAALDAFAVSKFDVLLTDVTLPGLSGIDLAREVARLRPSLPIVFASGYGTKLDLAPDLLGHAILPKPFDLAQLEGVLAGGS